MLWGNGSIIRSEVILFGGAVQFKHKQVFSMLVVPFNDTFKVVVGTLPKALSK